MKRKLLSLSLAVLSVMGLQAQATLVTGLPATNGATTQLRAPNGTSDHETFRGHLIIPASEVTGLSNGDVITTIGFTLTEGIAGVADGNIQFYLENTSDATNLKSTTWATAVTGMTSVYNGTISFPATASPANIDLTTNGSFTYTGGGIYVAYDYLGANFGTFPATYAANTLIAGGIKMEATATSTPAATLTASSSFRPEIRFGKTNPNANDMTVNDIRPVLGAVNRTYTASSDAIGFVTNTSNTALTNVDVTLTVTGANSYTSTQTIASIAAGDVEVLSFTGIPTTADGTNTYTLTVGNDDDNTNNSATATQEVSCNNMSYAPRTAPTSGLGYNTGTGIIAIAVDVPTSTAPAYITKVIPTIANASATNVIAGNTIKGVLVNSAGVIVDSTALYTMTAADEGNPTPLTFLNGGVDYSGQTVYVGFRQTANAAAGYFPQGTADEFVVLPNTYYTIGTNGGTPAAQTGFGAFLIDAELSFGDVSITGPAGTICAGTAVNLTAMPAGLDSYDFTVNGSSVQATASNTYTFTPTATSTYSVVGSVNGCTSTSATGSIDPVSQYTSSFSDDFCAGGSYTFGTQTLSAAGTYNETFTSTDGCDSVVTLTLSEISIDNSVTVSGATITASYVVTGVTYQWVDCDNNDTPIAGATSSSYTASASNGVVGNYAVVISEGGCSAQSACSQIDFTSIVESADNKLSVYPNPANNVLNVVVDLKDVKSFTVYNIEGQVVLRNNVSNNNTLTSIDINNLEAGTYLLEVVSNNSSARKVFVKQ